MKYKIFSFLLIFLFIFFSFYSSVFATDETENIIDYQEEEETVIEENQEEETENTDYSENLDNIHVEVSALKDIFRFFVFLFTVWFILDFYRHAFFKEGR